MASRLIAILARCGVRQSAIAQELGVSRATVSRWASGVRRMTDAQHARLLEWAQRAAMAAHDDAVARDAATPAGRTILSTPAHAARLAMDLQELWHDYRWERNPAAHTAIGLAILQRWGAYSQDLTPGLCDPKPEDEDRLWEDTKRLRGWIATRRRLRQTPEGKDPNDGS